MKHITPLTTLVCYCLLSGCVNVASAQTYTNLYSFGGSPDGADPRGGLLQGIDGNFYGTAVSGGTSNAGTVFRVTPAGRISVPLSPPANQISAIQKAGADIIVSIPSVAGETYQLQFRDSLTSGNWSNVAGASLSNSPGALLTITNLGGALPPQRFFRFAITP